MLICIDGGFNLINDEFIGMLSLSCEDAGNSDEEDVCS